MKTKLDDRETELVIFLEPESIEEAALLLRVAGSMKEQCDGYAGFHGGTIQGWLSIPMLSKRKTTIESGRWVNIDSARKLKQRRRKNSL